MRKIKNIVLSLLLVTVIAIGLSATVFAATGGAEYMECKYSGVERVADEFSIPYLRAYATYTGYGLYYPFQAYVWLNGNNQGALESRGNISWSTSGASVVYEPHYPEQPYSWGHGYDFIENYQGLID